MSDGLSDLAVIFGLRDEVRVAYEELLIEIRELKKHWEKWPEPTWSVAAVLRADLPTVPQCRRVVEALRTLHQFVEHAEDHLQGGTHESPK